MNSAAEDFFDTGEPDAFGEDCICLEMGSASFTIFFLEAYVVDFTCLVNLLKGVDFIFSVIVQCD